MRRKNYSSCCGAVILNVLLSFTLIGFLLIFSFPHYEINEKGDIIIRTKLAFMIDSFSVQIIQTDVTTLETEISDHVTPIKDKVSKNGGYSITEPSMVKVSKDKSEFTISNADMTFLYNAIFTNGNTCKITFGGVHARIKFIWLIILILAYIVSLFITIKYFYNQMEKEDLKRINLKPYR